MRQASMNKMFGLLLSHEFLFYSVTVTDVAVMIDDFNKTRYISE